MTTNENRRGHPALEIITEGNPIVKWVVQLRFLDVFDVYYVFVNVICFFDFKALSVFVWCGLLVEQ